MSYEEDSEFVTSLSDEIINFLKTKKLTHDDLIAICSRVLMVAGDAKRVKIEVRWGEKKTYGKS